MWNGRHIFFAFLFTMRCFYFAIFSCLIFCLSLQIFSRLVGALLQFLLFLFAFTPSPVLLYRWFHSKTMYTLFLRIFLLRTEKIDFFRILLEVFFCSFQYVYIFKTLYNQAITFYSIHQKHFPHCFVFVVIFSYRN